MKDLTNAQDSFIKCIEDILGMLEIDDPLYEKLMCKSDHYCVLFEDAEAALGERIWFLCCHNKLALPGTQPEQMDCFKRFNNGNAVPVGFIPPSTGHPNPLGASTPTHRGGAIGGLDATVQNEQHQQE